MTRTRYNATARRRWPAAAWVIGNGRYASVAHCRVTTVQLHATATEADRAKTCIDRTACGGGCYRDHHVIDLDEATTW